MINDIEYNKIIEFIEEEIINDKIINYSKISTSLFGAAKSIPRSEIQTSYITNGLVNNLLKSMPAVLGPKDGVIDNIPKIKSDNTSGLFIIVPVVGYIINLLVQNKDKISSDDLLSNIVKLISLVGMCLGIKDGLGIFKLVKQFLSAKDVGSSVVKDLLKSKNQLNKVLEGGSMISFDYLKNLGIYIWNSIQQMYNNSIIQKTVEKIKNWIINPDSSSAPEIDENTINEMDKIINGVIKKDIKKLEPLYNYYFDKSSGKIIYNGESNFKEIRTLISINDNFHIKSIEMITNKDKSIHYLINNSNTKIDSISQIEGNPVHTALVFAYMANKHNIVINEAKKYVYKIDDDGSIKIYLRNDSKEISKELPTITKAINLQKNNEEKNGIEYIKNTCKEIFGYDEGLSKESCAKHFYSILGRSAINMIQNLEKEIEKKPDIYDLLLSANPGIQYEILKNLDWKSKKNSENNLELINVEEWLTIRDDLEYKKYLNDKPKIKELLNQMIKKINLERNLLQPSEQTEINSNKTNIKRRIIKKKNMNLSKQERNNLQYLSLMENFILSNTNYNYNQSGGGYRKIQPDNLYFDSKSKSFNFKFFNDLDEKYKLLKESLENMNKKLSNTTDNEIRTKIEQIKTLHQKLELIYNKILNYIKIIRSDKKVYINNQFLDIDEIDNLIEQYNNYNNKKNKKLATISTAFGKLQIVLEDYNDGNSLNKQYYHNI